MNFYNIVNIFPEGSHRPGAFKRSHAGFIGSDWYDSKKSLPHATHVPSEAHHDRSEETSGAGGKRKNVDINRARQYLDVVLASGASETSEIVKDMQKRLETSPVFHSIKRRKTISFSSILNDATIGIEHHRLADSKAVLVPKTFEMYSNPAYHQSKGKGDEVLRSLRETLDQFGMKRHINQIRFHEEMIKACLRIIYRTDFEQNIDRVLLENNWDKIVQEVLIITARRIGKTTAVAIYAAALLMCVPKIEIMIFSVSQNSSRKMLLMITDFLKGHPVGNAMISSSSMDKLILTGGPGDARKAESRPGRGEVCTCYFFFFSPLKAPPPDCACPPLASTTYMQVLFRSHIFDYCFLLWVARCVDSRSTRRMPYSSFVRYFRMRRVTIY